MAEEETYTYRVKFGVATRYIGSDVTAEDSLEEYGYSDQDWDELSEREKNSLLMEWEQEFVWNNVESWGDVITDAV